MQVPPPSGVTETLTGIANLVPTLTLCAVVYAAGKLKQKMDSMAAEITRLRARVHKLNNLMTAAMGKSAISHLIEEEDEDK